MAYKKEYPVLNDSGAGSLVEYTKRQEDRIEGAFADIKAHIVEITWESGISAYARLSDGTIISWGRIWGTTNAGGELQDYVAGSKWYNAAPILVATGRRNSGTPFYPRVRSTTASGWFAVEFWGEGGELVRDTDVAMGYIAISKWK